MKEMLFGRKSRPMNFPKSSYLFLLLIAGLLLCLGFLWPDQQKHGNFSERSTKAQDSSQSIHIRYAKGFSVEEHADYTLINVFNPFQNHPDTLRYLLIPKGKDRPDVYPKAQTVYVPIRSLIVTSTTQLGAVELLQADDVVKGMVGAKYAYNPTIRKRLKRGEIRSFKGTLNKEIALNMHPEMIMVSSGQFSQFSHYKLLMRSGIAVFVNGNWLETTPLGRAEWMKAAGLFFGKEKKAQKKFKKISKMYNRLKSLAKKAGDEPMIVNNLPYKGAWFVSGGQSYMAQYFKDANANYPWYKNNSTGGLHLSFEAVYNAGLHADVWLNPGSAKTKADILADDPRLKAFKPFQTDRIYNNNKRMAPTGGNDFWEKGVVRPDLILSDMIKILHPDLLPDDSLYFYRKVK
jgi:iron complex transport system substrate-binding protein